MNFSRITSKIGSSYWVSSGIYTFLQRISITVSGFLSFIILVRLLDVNSYGIWVLYLSFISVAEMIREGFVKNPIIKRMVSEENDESHSVILWSAFLLNFLLFCIIVVILVVLTPILSSWMSAPYLETLIYLYIPNAFLYTFFIHYTSSHEAYLNFKFLFWSHFARRASFLIFSIVLYLFEDQVQYKLIFLAHGLTASILVGAVVAFLGTLSYRIHQIKFSTKHLVAIFHHGKFSFGTYISSILLNNIDSWMLGAMISPAAVGIYNPALKIARLVEIPMSTISSISYPKLIESNDEREIKNLFEKSVAAILIFMIPIIIIAIVFADQVVTFVAGNNFKDSVLVLQVIMLYGIFDPYNRQFGITLDAVGKANLTFYFVLCGALLNVILNYILIKNYGLIGAAISTVSAHILGFIVRHIFMRNLLNIRITSIMRIPASWFKYSMSRIFARL